MSTDLAGLANLLTPAQVLCALHDATGPQGMGLLHAIPGPVSLEAAEERVQEGTYVDYFLGRPIKCDVAARPLDVRLYERDAGPGAAQAALSAYVERMTR